ncbi:MAG: L-aspartate oxidase, partial [Actinobacteria bacterium]|nr:L-aspartate oxidase [Actinomycetota bacterium]
MLRRFLFSPENYDDICSYNECIIIGSGIAGLSTGIRISNHTKVKIFTKSALSESNTWYAQGGIAAAIKSPDSWEDHYCDTMKSGQGLCDTEAVKTLVKSAPEMIEDLIEAGIHFDIANGEIGLTLEGGHSSPRVLHAGGDATGEEIERKLIFYSKQIKNIEFYPENFVFDILTLDNECRGIIVLNIKKGKVEIHPTSNIIISTGGIGQLYELTTNPSVSTGDGISMAYRAGAEIKDIEFIQFHPTVFKTNDGKLFLITEALRGEGAFLRDTDGNRFMMGKHPLAELAPRDIVVKEMTMIMKEKGKDFVYLDATHLDRHMLTIRFPNIINKLKENGLDLKKDLIKVSPAAHYLNGGIKTNLNGETNIKGIYACGETAATGAHGANRLASNSLIEGLVYGSRIYNSIINKLKINDKIKNSSFKRDLVRSKDDFKKMLQKIIEDSKGEFENSLKSAKDLNTINKYPSKSESINIIDNAEINALKNKLRHLMTNRVGILREEKRLKDVLEFVNENLAEQGLYDRREKELCEFLNMLYVARLIITAAILRKESRGTHQRCD